MKWISVSDRIPSIPEEVELWNGKRCCIGFIWDDPKGGTYFECEDEEKPFLATFWRPQKNSCIEENFFKSTWEVTHPDLQVKNEVD